MDSDTSPRSRLGDPVVLSGRVIAGEPRAVARLISGLEDGDPAALEAMRALRGRSGRAHLIGITGPPGAGKSTLSDKMITSLRERGSRVGVLAVDPSSPFSGGAILGDRLRMNAHATDEGVFIRSLASRGQLGGLSRATQSAARVLDAAGYDYILIETVGVGQSEVDVVKLADTVILISVPGLGDDIQTIKAGIMEIGDIFVVNKADRDGADRVVREIRSMLETAQSLKAHQVAPASQSVDTLAGRSPELAADMAHHRSSASGVFNPELAPLDNGETTDEWTIPPVIKTVAETGEGVEELVEAVLAHRARLLATGELETRRFEAARAELRSLIAYRLMDALEGKAGRAREDALARAALDGETDLYTAADELFAALVQGGRI